MARIEPYGFRWTEFNAGMVTAIDPHSPKFPVQGLGKDAFNVFPYKFGYLAQMPTTQVLASDYSSQSGFLIGTPEKVVGSYVWQPVSGRDILILAVYGDWQTKGKGTQLVAFTDPADGENHGSYQDVFITFIRGDAPVRFTSYPMTNPTTGRRSNWLVVCSPYDYARAIELYDLDKGYTGQIDYLPYFWADVEVFKRRLLGTGAVDVSHRLYYSASADSVESFNSLDIGEESGDPNVFFVKAFDAIYIQKSRSTWVLLGSTPEQWQAVRVLSERGSCVAFPPSAEFGVIGCDIRGVYHSDGQHESDAGLSQAVPEIRGEPADLPALFEAVQAGSRADFDAGGYTDTARENLGTDDTPIDVLTLDRDVVSAKDDQVGDTNAKVIAPTQEEYQTFKAVGGYGTGDRYWATSMEVKVKRNGAVDSDIYVELVQYTGSASSPDSEEILAADMIVDIDAVLGFEEITFDYPILIRCDEYKYMIRVLGVTNSTDWHYNNAGGYADGEASWAAGEDACFKVNGFNYLATGTWLSPWYECTDVTLWGALLYKALELEEGWASRVSLKYRYRQSGGLTTDWQQFTGTGPDGGGMTNEFDESYDELRFEVTLRTVGEIPPFIDYLMATFSREIMEMAYPSGLEALRRLYLGGMEPNRNDVIIRSEMEDGGLFVWNDQYLSHFVRWRGNLYAGKTGGANPGAVVRIMRDTDEDCEFTPELLLVDGGFQGIDDPRDKQLSYARVVWEQQGDVGDETDIKIDIYVVVDDTLHLHLFPTAGDVQTRWLGAGRYEWTVFAPIEDNVLTRECACRVTAWPKSSDTRSQPFFVLKEFTVFADAWPETPGVA